MYKKGISVIVVTYNGVKYIQQQLESILTQTIAAAEIIVCDDISTDGTIEVLKNFEIADKIKLFINTERLGVVANCKNAAMLAREGNLIVFADQDDVWVPHKLKRMYQSMELLDDSVTPALIYTDMTVIDKHDNVIATSFWAKQHIRPAKINLATLLYGNTVTGCTIMLNYNMALEFFKMESYDFYHDEWLALIAYTIGKVEYISEQLVLYRQHENNITFSEQYETLLTTSAIISNCEYFLGKREFLPARQFGLAKTFLQKYKWQLTNLQIKVIENFINQQHKSYLIQRIKRRITFS